MEATQLLADVSRSQSIVYQSEGVHDFTRQGAVAWNHHACLHPARNGLGKGRAVTFGSRLWKAKTFNVFAQPP